jgi:hypothetical protein
MAVGLASCNIACCRAAELLHAMHCNHGCWLGKLQDRLLVSRRDFARCDDTVYNAMMLVPVGEIILPVGAARHMCPLFEQCLG